MITGAHFLFYSTDADADRAFLRDVLEFRSVDAGHGWLIFALPPSEIAVHPSDSAFVQSHADGGLAGAVLYLMCDDLSTSVQALAAKGVPCTPAEEAPWGLKTTFRLPSGSEIGLYEPRHPTAVELG